MKPLPPFAHGLKGVPPYAAKDPMAAGTVLCNAAAPQHKGLSPSGVSGAMVAGQLTRQVSAAPPRHKGISPPGVSGAMVAGRMMRQGGVAATSRPRTLVVHDRSEMVRRKKGIRANIEMNVAKKLARLGARAVPPPWLLIHPRAKVLYAAAQPRCTRQRPPPLDPWQRTEAPPLNRARRGGRGFMVHSDLDHIAPSRTGSKSRGASVTTCTRTTIRL